MAAHFLNNLRQNADLHYFLVVLVSIGLLGGFSLKVFSGFSLKCGGQESHNGYMGHRQKKSSDLLLMAC